MTWMDRMSALLARKSSRASAAVAAVGLAPARWTPRRYDRLAEEGYRKNVLAYRCVREVARACASVPWLLYKGRSELDTHPLLDLLRRPNPRQSGPELIEAAIGHLLLSGNAYLEVIRPDGEAPRELYALRPDRMRIVPDVSGVPRAYRYEVEGRGVDWPVDPISGASDVLHLRDFHPLDDWYGLSPIEAAAAAIDQHNAAAEHNAALLQNGARPSGALVFRADPGPDSIRRVEEALLDRTQGPRQAGRPLVLGGDVDWKELGFSPKDMDFAELKSQAAREIAAAFGVPHLLVVSGEATYSNRTYARLELWEHTVIPLLDRLASALSSWLGPLFGENLRLAHDLDEVPALAPRRRLKWQQIQQADFLTLNEKRQALGYAPVADGDGEGEQKNSEEFRRLHGYEQPRNPAGGQDGGRWSRSPESFVSLLQGRVIQSPGTRRPPVGRPGAGSGGQRGGGGGIPPRLPPRNPFPDKPECNEQWRRAVEDCKAEDDRMAAQPWSARSSRLFGYDYLDCLEIRISEECGGKPIGKKAMTGLKGACEMSSHPTSDRDPPLIKRAKDLSSAGDYEGAIESYTLHLTQFPEDASAFRWRAFALQQTERFAEAIVDLERSLCIAPGFPPAVFHRAEALAALGYYDEALDEFDRLEVAVPGYNTQTIAMFRAHCLIELGRYEEALANIRRLPDGRGIVGRERAALMERLPVDRRDAR